MKTERVCHHSSLDIDLDLEGFSSTQYNCVNGKKSTQQSHLLKEFGPTSLTLWLM
jgi:hypothetical protein